MRFVVLTLPQVQGVYSVNESDVNQLALVASEQDNREAAIDSFWQGLKTQGRTAVPFTVSTAGSQTVVRHCGVAPTSTRTA